MLSPWGKQAVREGQDLGATEPGGVQREIAAPQSFMPQSSTLKDQGQGQGLGSKI